MVLFGHEDMAEFFSVRNGKLSILKMRLFSDKDSKARRPGFAYTHSYQREFRFSRTEEFARQPVGSLGLRHAVLRGEDFKETLSPV
jgi:hypothetical protein